MVKLFKWIEETAESIRNASRTEEYKTIPTKQSSYSKRCSGNINSRCYNQNRLNKINRKIEDLEGLIYDNLDE